MAAPVLVQKVRLTFSATNLKSKDLLSQSDAFAYIYERDASGKLNSVFKTEVINNNANPRWNGSYEVDYHFEKNQQYRIEIYDYDEASNNDLISHADFTLGNVMSAYGSALVVQLTKAGKTKPSKKTAVTITGTQMVVSKLYATCDIRIKDLKKSSMFANFDKDDTMFQMLKIKPDGTELLIYQSEIVYDTQKPDFKQCTIPLGDLCDANMNQPFIVRLLRLKSNGDFEFMGENRTLTPQMIRVEKGELEKKVDLFNVKGKDICDLFFEKFAIQEQHSFLDYIMAGLDINFTVAIDFTGSNGNPSSPSSLHYLDPSGAKKNQYIEALRSVGNILAAYCQKAWIPAIGYGGHVSIDGQAPVTSHCFPLTLSSQHPFCAGIPGIEQAYINSLQHVQLSGPTYFEAIIQSATQTALRPFAPDYQHFNVLLILTDGIINDMDKTIDAIVQASDKPMAIVIVGVGDADFSAMEALDGDKTGLKSKKYGKAANDIVQFVEFKPYMNHPEKLAEATLKELPSTIERFMRMHSINPALQRQVVQVQAQPPVQM